MKRMFWLLLLAALTSGMMRYAVERKTEADLKQCQLNLKNLATALEIYSTDIAGRYPRDIGKVVPIYLKEIPVCPGADAGQSIYALQTATLPDAFSICCQGFNHQPKIQIANHPQYFNCCGPER